MKEIKWKDIKGYEGRYKVSNNGDVYSYYSKRNLKPSRDKVGYMRITLTKNGKPTIFLIHRLVGFAFLNGYVEGYDINHKNADKSDNWFENLEWISHQDNMTHSSQNQLNTRSEYTCKIDNSGNVLEIYPSIFSAGRENNLDNRNVYKTCIGEYDSNNNIRIRFYDTKTKSYVKTRFDRADAKTKGKYRRKIICLETNDIAKTQQEMANKLNISQSGIANVLRGKKNSHNGYHFKYLEE